MQPELVILLVMLAVFAAGCFVVKLPVGIALALAAAAGALAAGEGIPVRHLVEGTFVYLDTVVVIATAMMFMKVVQESGALMALSGHLVCRFYKHPAILLIFLMVIVMFPGMITGSSTAAVLSAGSIIAPVLITMGLPATNAAAFIAMGGLLGMIAPPVNIPAMIICSGVDMPYVGFEIPGFLLSIPLAIFSALFLGCRHCMGLDHDRVASRIGLQERKNYGPLIYLPIAVVIALMVLSKIFPLLMPNLGMPVIFLIGSFVGLFTGERINAVRAAKDAIREALPVMGILMGVGMFIQVMTLTGVRGYVVVSCLGLPSFLLYLGLALAVPVFGAVSAFGSASVLGVPFVLALLGQNQVITVSAISQLAGLGDLMPPTALAGIFAAQVVGIDNYFLVLKKCIVPALVCVFCSLLFIICSNVMASIIF